MRRDNSAANTPWIDIIYLKPNPNDIACSELSRRFSITAW
jgi:hypothetical protein